MRFTRILFALLALAVLGLSVSEPADAHPGAEIGWSMDHDADTDAPEGESHHHCPLSPDVPVGASASAPRPGDEQRFAAKVAHLSSRSQAPPIEPPAA